MLDIIRNRAQSWGVKIIFGIIILVFIFWGMDSFNAQSLDVLLKVNGQNITLNDFSKEFDNYVKNIKARMPNLPDEFFQTEEQTTRVLTLLRDKTLLTQAAQGMGLTVSVAEIQREIMTMPRFRDPGGQFSLQQYDASLAQDRIKKSDFENLVRQGILLRKMQRTIVAASELSEEEAFANFRHMQETRQVEYYFFDSGDYLEKVEVSDAQAAEYYEKNKTLFTVPKRIDVEYLSINPQALAVRYEVSPTQAKEYYEANKAAFTEEAQVEVRHILFLADQNSSQEDLEQLRQRAEGVHRQALDGANFAELARLNSDDPSAANGGEMGWVKISDLIPVFSEQIGNLKPGEMTKPFSSLLGYHIIKVEGRKDARQLEFDEVSDQISLLMAAERGAEEMPDILDQVVGEILNGQDLAASAKALGLATAHAEGLVREDAGTALEISPDSVESLFLTPEGITIDRPIASGSGYVFVRITRAQEEYVAPQEEVRERIDAVLKAEESRVIAAREADKLFETLQKDSEVQESAKLKLSDFFNRQSGIEEAGPAPEFTNAVFEQAALGQWVAPFATSRGSIIARLKDIRSPSDEQWRASREMVIMQLAMVKQEGLVQAYLNDLLQRADISNYNPELIRFEN